MIESTTPKYRFTGETKTFRGVTLHRICRPDGQLGGWLESEDNLSHKGRAWVAEEAIVMGEAKVREYATVKGEAVISGRARVYAYATVSGCAEVTDSARVYGRSRVGGHCQVIERARVGGWAEVQGSACIAGHALLCDQVRVKGGPLITGEAVLSGRTIVSGAVSIDETTRWEREWHSMAPTAANRRAVHTYAETMKLPTEQLKAVAADMNRAKRPAHNASALAEWLND